jgi:hypothetical protein
MTQMLAKFTPKSVAGSLSSEQVLTTLQKSGVFQAVALLR